MAKGRKIMARNLTISKAERRLEARVRGSEGSSKTSSNRPQQVTKIHVFLLTIFPLISPFPRYFFSFQTLIIIEEPLNPVIEEDSKTRYQIKKPVVSQSRLLSLKSEVFENPHLRTDENQLSEISSISEIQ